MTYATAYTARRGARSRLRRRTLLPPGQWVPVPGHTGYFVDANGRVLGRSGRVLQPQPIDGYERVKLDGQHVMVHRIVMLAFVGPAPGGHEINHRNGRKDDNRLSNLEYVTPAENVAHSISVLGRVRAPGEANGNARLSEETVRDMRHLYDAGGITTAQIGVLFDVDRTHARRICTQQVWRHVS